MPSSRGPARLRCGLALLGALSGLFAAMSLQAQTYPSRPLRMVSPYAPGGGSDTLARALGQKLNEAWGQPVVVDNRPGAAASIGTEMVARSQPDGYTILVTPSAALTINPHLYSKLRYDTFKDFAPITIAANSPFLFVVHASVPATSLKELIAHARANPKKLNYSSSGNGSSTHLAGVMFNNMAGTDIVHVPYKGAAPANVDLLAGVIQVRFASVVPVMPHVRAGRVRALAISSEKRYSPLPDMPTISEAGLPGFIVESFYAIVVPAATPRSVIEKLNAELVRILRDPQIKARMAADGSEAIGSTPEELGAALRRDFARWAKPVKDSGARAD